MICRTRCVLHELQTEPAGNTGTSSTSQEARTDLVARVLLHGLVPGPQRRLCGMVGALLLPGCGLCA